MPEKFPIVPEDERQALRLRRYLMAAGTSFMVIVLLYTAYLLGGLEWAGFAMGAALILLLIAFFYTMLRTGANLRFRDPSMTMPQLRLRDEMVAANQELVTAKEAVEAATLAKSTFLAGMSVAEHAPPALVTPPVEPSGERLADRHPLRVLVAEDNGVNQKVALAMLRMLGYRADLAADGREAVEAVRRVPYDVVLMDLQMPELDGVDATRQILAEHSVGRRPRIVALTANAFEEDRETCFAAGMDDYVSKPLKVETLEAALSRASRITAH